MGQDDMVEYLAEALAQRQDAQHQAIGSMMLVLRHLAAASESIQRMVDTLSDANEYTAAHAGLLGVVTQQAQNLV